MGILGAFSLIVVDSDVIMRIIGLIILLYIINDHFKLTKHIKVHDYGITAAGAAYGYLSGISSMANPSSSTTSLPEASVSKIDSSKTLSSAALICIISPASIKSISSDN